MPAQAIKPSQTLNYHKWRNQSKKSVGVTIQISIKIDFQPKVIKKDKEGHILIKVKIFQEELSILNIYAPNEKAVPFIKESSKHTLQLTQ